MSIYPGGVYSPRTKENKPGVVYDAAKTKNCYAEDITKLDDEVVAIETELGTNPKGAYASVKAFLADLLSKVISAFTDIPDVPSSYTGEGGKVVQVKATEDGLEFGAGGGGLTYVGIEPPAFDNPSVANTWEDWDLSALIPAGAKYVDILSRTNTSSIHTVGVRKNGSSIVRSLATDSYDGIPYPWLTELDENRVVERYVSGASNRSRFTVLGYWI